MNPIHGGTERGKNGTTAAPDQRRAARREPWPTPADVMEEVLGAARQFVRADDLQTVLRRAAEVACHVLGYDLCAVAWRGNDADFRYEALVGGTTELWTSLQQRTLTGDAFDRLVAAALPIRNVRWVRAGHPVREDPEVAAGLEPTNQAVTRGGWRPGSLLIVPIGDEGGRVVGFLSPDDPVSGELPTTANAVLLEALAELAEFGVEAMRARHLARCSLAAAEGRRRQVEGLLAASVAVRSHGNLGEVLAGIARAMTTAADFERAAVYLLQDPATFIARATVGLSPDEDVRLRTTPVPREEFGALMQRRMLVSRSFLCDHRYFEVPASLGEKLSLPAENPNWEEGMWHALDSLTVPLEDRGGELIGVISVDEPRSRRFPDADAVRLLELFADQCSVAVTEARRYEQAVSAATTDHLTGLANRPAFLVAAGRLLTQAGRRDPDCAVVFIDIDRFKGINDRFGHAVGDDALQAVGRLLAERLRAGDLVARYGGDEFVALLTDTTAAEAAAIVGQLRQRLGKVALPALGYERIRLTAGIVQVRPGESISEAVERADAALYVAKQAGRDRIHVAGPGRPPQVPDEP